MFLFSLSSCERSRELVICHVNWTRVSTICLSGVKVEIKSCSILERGGRSRKWLVTVAEYDRFVRVFQKVVDQNARVLSAAAVVRWTGTVGWRLRRRTRYNEQQPILFDRQLFNGHRRLRRIPPSLGIVGKRYRPDITAIINVANTSILGNVKPLNRTNSKFQDANNIHSLISPVGYFQSKIAKIKCEKKLEAKGCHSFPVVSGLTKRHVLCIRPRTAVDAGCNAVLLTNCATHLCKLADLTSVFKIRLKKKWFLASGL